MSKKKSEPLRIEGKVLHTNHVTSNLRRVKSQYYHMKNDRN